MKLLLDSHVLVWWLADDRRLTDDAAAAIEDGANDVIVSAATVSELEIKRAKGTLPSPADLVEQVAAAGFRGLPITAEHARAAARLPPHHNDPFDRMLVAQARAESAVLASADAALGRYEVALLRVGPR